jgi:putative PIN family toxin of toxin-antitoxin system
MIRVVLDTSVVVAAVISPKGPNAQVFDLVVTGKTAPCVSPAILAEYQAVFSYDHLRGLDRRRIDRLIGLLD